MTDPSLAQQERQTLCDLFVAHGPGAATLCEGWLTADLAAHLVVPRTAPRQRARTRLAPVGRLHGQGATHGAGSHAVGEARRDRAARAAVAPPSFRWADEHRRVLHPRGGRAKRPSGWEPRPISSDLADALSAHVGPGGMAKKVPATISDHLAGTGRQGAWHRAAPHAGRRPGRAHDVRLRSPGGGEGGDQRRRSARSPTACRAARRGRG